MDKWRGISIAAIWIGTGMCGIANAGPYIMVVVLCATIATVCATIGNP
ncbi:hypothetical protein ACFL2D_02935 [Patescibacteria group bacterium]